MPPLVSIVLPTYNGSRFVEQSIRSCLGQTYRDVELIVVDDASTDGTPSIIDHYREVDRRVRSARHETNRKLPGSLNTGFAIAKGDYLTWTSDDNIYLPNAIEEMVAFLDDNEDVDVVYADYSVIDHEGAVLDDVRNPPACELVDRCCIGACFLYRRRVHQKVGGYAESLFCAEDYDFWLRASAHFRFEPLHRNLYLYRHHENSLTSQKRDRILRATHETKARNIPRLSWIPASERALAQLRLAEEDALWWRRRLEACGHLALALKTSPRVAAASDPGLFVRTLLGRPAFDYLHFVRHLGRVPGRAAAPILQSQGRLGQPQSATDA